MMPGCSDGLGADWKKLGSYNCRLGHRSYRTGNKVSGPEESDMEAVTIMD